MKFVVSLFTPRLPVYFAYMLQQVEYDPTKFRTWFKRVGQEKKSITSVMHRQQLVWTSRAKMIVLALYALWLAIFIVVAIASFGKIVPLLLLLCAALIASPYILASAAMTIAFVAHRLIVRPQNTKLIKQSKEIFSTHKATKIAVIGSYGKTTMKELLSSIISEELDVAATPGNMNVQVSHARYAFKLSGEEEVLIVEFGEGEPGDVEAMTETVRPDWAIITGLAPNHLDYYPSLEAVASDLLSVANSVPNGRLLVNGDSKLLEAYVHGVGQRYNSSEVMGWRISQVDITAKGTSFTMKKGQKTIYIKSKLLGRHQVGPLACAAALADELGVEVADIEKGAARTEPFEHRMQPRFVNGAILIDDTYNGNIEGMIAGLNLLSELDMERKWYVTPGLVDQGPEFENVHGQLGEAIAAANPDIVVLMDNSARSIIEASLKQNGFSGELRIESDPLAFYQGLEHRVAVGDLVLMQNDWTDNYN